MVYFICMCSIEYFSVSLSSPIIRENVIVISYLNCNILPKKVHAQVHYVSNEFCCITLGFNREDAANALLRVGSVHAALDFLTSGVLSPGNNSDSMSRDASMNYSFFDESVDIGEGSDEDQDDQDQDDETEDEEMEEDEDDEDEDEDDIRAALAMSMQLSPLPKDRPATPFASSKDTKAADGEANDDLKTPEMKAKVESEDAMTAANEESTTTSKGNKDGQDEKTKESKEDKSATQNIEAKIEKGTASDKGKDAKQTAEMTKPKTTSDKKAKQESSNTKKVGSTSKSTKESAKKTPKRSFTRANSIPKWFKTYCSVALTIDTLYRHYFNSASVRGEVMRSQAIDSEIVQFLQALQQHQSAKDWETEFKKLSPSTYSSLLSSSSSSSSSKSSSTSSKSMGSVKTNMRLFVQSQSGKKVRQRFKKLDTLGPSQLVDAMCLFVTFNRQICEVLPYIDLSRAQALDKSSLGYRLSALRCCILPCVIGTFVDRVLAATSSPEEKNKPRIIVDRLSAAAQREVSTSKDLAQQNTIFSQVYHQLASLPPSAFLSPRPSGSSPHTAFNVVFKGENVVGEGGPYRQLFTDICKELQGGENDEDTNSSQISMSSLFIPTSNNQASVGTERDKYVPRPTANSSHDLACFEFVGRLMGIAMRTNILLPLYFPSFFWKPMVGQDTTHQDLALIDTTFARGILDRLKGFGPQDEALFDAAFGDSLFFSTTLSDCVPVDLKEDGASLPVRFQQRQEYAAMAYKARMNESRYQLRALHKGFSAVVPEALTALFPWQDFQQRLCGRAEVDLDLLRRHTEYSAGVDSKAPYISWFWEVLNEFDHEDRRKFIKFTWAQERLPSSDADFSRGGHQVRMLIKPAVLLPNQNVDSRFPRADTCFFNLELPAYTSKEVMRRMLNTIIHLASAMDGDTAPESAQTGIRSPAEQMNVLLVNDSDRNPFMNAEDQVT